MILIGVVFLTSCKSGQPPHGKNRYRLKKAKDKEINNFLLKAANDTSVFYVPALAITDSAIFPVLDSAIAETERCEYFDERIRYFHAFTFSYKRRPEGKVLYSICTHESKETALGVWVNRGFGINAPGNVGVFYHRGYLFVIPFRKKRNEYINELPFWYRWFSYIVWRFLKKRKAF